VFQRCGSSSKIHSPFYSVRNLICQNKINVLSTKKKKKKKKKNTYGLIKTSEKGMISLRVSFLRVSNAKYN
jgi:hypothetical protein